MNRIEVYSTDNCPWCDHAKSLLRTRGLDFEEIDISPDQTRALEMIERSGRRTVPQIFIDNVPTGGFDELSMIDLPYKQDEDHTTLSKEESTMTDTRPPLPPYTAETAAQKVRLAKNAWNSRDPEKVSLAYTPDSKWRNRAEFVSAAWRSSGSCNASGPGRWTTD